MNKTKETKQIIFDTDIGMDCDDAAALGILLNAHKRGECEILAITASTGREGATATVNAICDYYGVNGIPVGRMKRMLQCDGVNNYARAVMEKYGTKDVETDAVPLLRKTLAEAAGKVSVIAVGPLSNLEELLKSKADEFSPLCGADLVKQKVDKLYVMIGSFPQNFDGKRFREWNLLQDVPAARYVIENWGTKKVYLPFEIGAAVFTEMGQNENPVWYSMKNFAIANGADIANGYRRESWDPVTCMIALNENNPLFIYSPEGTVTVDGDCVTLFEEKTGGLDKYLSVNSDLKGIEKLLNLSVEKK